MYKLHFDENEHNLDMLSIINESDDKKVSQLFSIYSDLWCADVLMFSMLCMGMPADDVVELKMASLNKLNGNESDV